MRSIENYGLYKSSVICQMVITISTHQWHQYRQQFEKCLILVRSNEHIYQKQC